MISILFAVLLSVAVARPADYSTETPRAAVEAILRDDRVYPSATGEYKTHFETEEGIAISESGAGTGPNGAVETQGSVSFTFPDGRQFDLTFVADANGYQPKSDWLPVAPAFPHPIPQFVLDQIAFAARQDEARDNEQTKLSYDAPKTHTLDVIEVEEVAQVTEPITPLVEIAVREAEEELAQVSEPVTSVIEMAEEEVGETEEVVYAVAEVSEPVTLVIEEIVIDAEEANDVSESYGAP